MASLDGVTRRYRSGRGTVTAVEDIGLSVHSGEVVGIAGPSGCGKSTLLRLLAGLERPDAGQLHYLGRPMWPISQSDNRLFGVSGRLVRLFAKHRAGPVSYPRAGFVMPVFQDPFASVDPRWPIWRIVTEPLAVRGRVLPGRERRVAASDWLERAALGHLRPDARPGELSGGQCQRLALVRAMVAEPALIVADEPTARQDVITAAAMTRLLREAADQGVALAVVSHDETWLALLADHIYRLGPAASIPDQ